METAVMHKSNDGTPANIERAERLEIQLPCEASDVFRLIHGKTNISTVMVNGEEYTRQHVMNMEPWEKLGSGRQRYVPIFTEGEPVPAPQTQTTAIPTQGRIIGHTPAGMIYHEFPLPILTEPPWRIATPPIAQWVREEDLNTPPF